MAIGQHVIQIIVEKLVAPCFYSLIYVFHQTLIEK